MTWVRRLLDPTPQVWKNLVWEHLNGTYGVLAQGELLFASSVDFSQLPREMPSFFRGMCLDWGRLCTPAREQPTTRQAVLREPLLYNPIARENDTFESSRFFVNLERLVEIQPRLSPVFYGRSQRRRRQ